MKGYEYLNSLMSDAKLLVQKKKKQFKNLLCLSYFFLLLLFVFLIGIRMSNLSLNQIERNKIEDKIIKDIRNFFKRQRY